MSLTPGWVKEDENLRAKMLRYQRTFFLLMPDCYVIHLEIDQESKYKTFPRTKQGWEDLCDELKNFEP